PPPVASKKPATRPRRVRNRGEYRGGRRREGAGGRAKRIRTVTPRARRNAETRGRASATGSDERTKAPANAPIAPGRARRQTTARSTLPKRQWAMPETSVVTTSPACTEADTVAGARPRVRSSVVDVTPYPIP